MPITAYLKIGDIEGESQRVDHENEIDVHDIMWNIEQGSAAQVGKGRSRARAQVEALTVRKFVDRSTVYLALACMQGKSFPEMTIAVRKDSGEAHLDYLVYVLTNVTISKFETLGVGAEEGGQLIEEEVALNFEEIKVTYTLQEDDHSAGAEEEIEYDVAAGV